MKKQEKGITLIALIITIVVLLILAVVSIKAVQDGGIITHAQNAASKMNKAQIEEKANLTKLEFTTDCYTNKDLKKSIQEFRNRLIEAFDVKADTNNDNIIEVNDKYAVVIKNTNLDIEVVEITNTLKASSLVSLTYTATNDIEDDGQPAIINLEILITKLMSLEDYGKLTISSDVTQEDKEKVVLDFYGNQLGTTFNNLDEALLYIINYNYKTEFTTIEECLTTLGTTREQLYYSFYNNTDLNPDNTMSKEDLINNLYPQVISSDNYNALTKKLSLYVKVDGGEEELIKKNIYPTATINYKIGTNNKYEFILRTESGTEITREIMQIKNIIKTPYVLTTQEADGVWSYTSTGMITKYTGTDKNVTIPAKIGDTIIDYIGMKAFYNRDDIKNITIPSTIETISQNVFEGCDGLTSITIPDSVTKIDMYAFKDCINLANIEIKGNLTEIGVTVFDGCTGLTNITIPESVEKIGNFAFRGCSSLTNITIPENVKTIGNQAFTNCSRLESVTILGNVTSIASDTFSNCTNLTNIYFKNSTWPSGEPWGATNATVSQLSQ